MIGISYKASWSSVYLPAIMLVLGGCTASPTENTGAKIAVSQLDSAGFTKLRNEPTLDLVEEKLESTGYQPLGLPIVPMPGVLKTVVLVHEKGSPTPHSPTAPTLAGCQFWGVRIEMDDKESTAEWLFTPDNRCGRQSRNQTKTFWILQQAKGEQPQVLLAGRAFRVNIRKKEPKDQVRQVAIMLKNTAPSRYTGKSMDVQCHLHWVNEGGTYQRVRDFVEVYREDAMLRGKNWMPVYGSDSVANVDAEYECSLD